MHPFQHLFVTGTDTGVGKTRVSAALLRALAARGLRTSGMKPVASGCERTADGLRNDDALTLQREATVRWPYEHVNPFAYEPAIAPHLAADEAGRPVEIDVIRRNFEQMQAASDAIVVEGAGGWLVPLGRDGTFADLAADLELRVVLVVGLRLGCLNHAFLTARAIIARGLPLAGWVANTIDPAFDRLDGNLATLDAGLPAPRRGRVPYLPDGDVARAAAARDLAPLFR